MKLIERAGKDVIALLLLAVMLIGLAPAAFAAGEGSFCLFVATTSQTIIAPTRIDYTAGQTIQEALDASGYSFVRHGTFIDLIEGMEGSYEIVYDGGGYDLSQPASDITALIISENQTAAEEHLELLRYMVQYNEMTNHVQNYQPAKTAYSSALNALQIGNAAVAVERLNQLQESVASYEELLGGTKYPVVVTASQNGAALTNPVLTLTDTYGNVTTVTGTTAEVVAGTYTVSVSDGNWNRAERTVSVSGRTPLSFDLPYGEWFGEISLIDQSTREVYEKDQNASAHTLTVQVPDTAGLTNPIVNAAPGSGLPSTDAKLYGVYTGTNGTDYGNTAKAWASYAASLPYLFAQGMGERTFPLEARYTSDDGATQIQSYTVILERVPTLKSLAVVEENTTLPLTFDPMTNSYTVASTASAVTITAEAFDSSYTVSGAETVSLDGDTTKTITVGYGSRSNSYTVNIQKKTAVNVTLSVPSGTTAAVYNSADSEIKSVSGVYHLVPGEEYYYIATKDTYYHTREPFTAASGLTVSVVEPEAANRLSDFAIYNSNNATTRKAYMLDEAFSDINHSLACTVPDAVSALYAQATPASGYTVQILYNKQTANTSTNGTPNTVTIGNAVGATSTNVLAGCLIAGGFSQNLTVQVFKEDNTVTQYQDYTLLLRRSEHLRSLALSEGTAPLTLLNSDGAATRFDRDTTAYTVSVDRGVTVLTLNASFINEGAATPACGGYYALVNGQRYETVSNLEIPLDQQQDSEAVTIQVCHADGNAVNTTYTVTLKKTDPVSVTFNSTPASATVFVTNNTTGKRITGEENTFALIPGQAYTYTVTAVGYMGQQVTDYTVPESAATVTVELEQAAENTGLPDYGAFWGTSRFDHYNNAVVNVKTPTTAENAALYWATKVGDGYSSDACGCPIIVDDYLYTYAGTKIYKIDTVSGEVLATGTMDHASSFAINTPTYADGMLFVGEANGTIQAFNADTLQSLWIYHDALFGQPDCPIVYHNGYIYTGFWNGDSAQANYICLSVTDEDPFSPVEEKLPTWTYTSPGGFYWAGAYVTDNYLLLCTDDGSIGYTTGYAKILSLSPQTGELLDGYTMTAPGDLRSGVTFAPDGSGGGRGYFTSKGGYFYRVDVNGDGTFIPGSLKGLRLTNYTSEASNPAMSVSTPTVYNGRAYVGVSGTSQFGQYSGHSITVIDLNNWSIAYTVRTQGYPQTSGLLTTSYEEETGSVNVYFFDNYTPGKLRMITDHPGQTAAAPTTVESYTSGGKTTDYTTGYVLFTPHGDQAQYCICSPIVDAYGTIYFKNDSAYMMALGSTITKLEITTQPDKTTYAVGEMFDATGMVVTATYSNGMTRDVTKYLEWSEAALTEKDTQFQIYFPYMMYHDENGVTGANVEEPFAVVELHFAQQEILYGDVNGDGKINTKDVILLRQYIAKYDVDSIDLSAADVNGDGKINTKDVILLRQYIAKYDVILGP